MSKELKQQIKDTAIALESAPVAESATTERHSSRDIAAEIRRAK